MKVELPSVDELIKMGKESPEKLEDLKLKLINLIIDRQSNENSKTRLKALQIKIDNQVNLSNNHLQAAVKISNLMHLSIKDLNYVFLNGKRQTYENSKIIEFKSKNKTT